MACNMRRSLELQLICLGALLALYACGGTVEISDEDKPPALEEAISNPNPWVRAETARLVGWSQHPNRQRHLQRLGQDSSSLVQAAATSAMLQRGLLSANDTGRLNISAASQEARIRLLRYYAELSSGPARRQLLEAAVRDANPTYRAAAIDIAGEMSVPLSSALLTAARDDTEHEVSEAAIRLLAQRNEEEALSWVIDGLRHERTERRIKALHALRLLNRAEFWPILRQRMDSAGPEERAAIVLVLGHLGDLSVEDTLRQVILSGSEGEVILAIQAIVNIPTPRARQQPLLMLGDQRPAVRLAALRATLSREPELSEIEHLILDRDPLIRHLVLSYLANSQQGTLQAWLQDRVQERTSSQAALTALLRLSQDHDITELLEDAVPLLSSLSHVPDETISELAIRLLFAAGADVEAQRALLSITGTTGSYLKAEWLLKRRQRNEDWEAELAQSDLLLLRVAAELIEHN